MDLRLMQDVEEAFHLVSRMVKGAPKLPEEVEPGMLPVLAALRRIQDNAGKAKVTDISSYLRLTSPSVIRIVGRCEKAGFIVKWKDEEDKRVTNVRLTERGENLLTKTLDPYHERLREKYSQIPDEDWENVVRVIHQAYIWSNEVNIELENQLPDWQEN